MQGLPHVWKGLQTTLAGIGRARKSSVRSICGREFYTRLTICRIASTKKSPHRWAFVAGGVLIMIQKKYREHVCRNEYRKRHGGGRCRKERKAQEKQNYLFDFELSGIQRGQSRVAGLNLWQMWYSEMGSNYHFRLSASVKCKGRVYL